MSDPGAPDHITRPEFQNFYLDVKDEFKEVHKCTERIEGKIDKLTEKINPILADYLARKADEKKKWSMQLLVFGSAVGGAFSVVTAIILYALSIGG